MDFFHLDLTNERLVMEILAIHCTYPMEWGADLSMQSQCVARHRARLDAPYAKTVVCAQDVGRIVGLYWVEVPIRRRAFARSIWIDPAYRRQHIATELIARGQTWLIEQGVEHLETEIQPQNDIIRQLLLDAGFQAKGLRYSRSLKGK